MIMMMIYNMVYILVLNFDGCHWIENCLFSDKEIPYFGQQEKPRKEANGQSIHKVRLTSQPPYCFICKVKNSEHLGF